MSGTAKYSIEEQLALYRAYKKKEEEKKTKKKRIWELITWIMSFGSSRSGSETSVSGSSSSEDIKSEDKEIQSQQTVEREKGLRRRSGLSKDSSSGTSTDYADPQGLSQPSILESYTTLDWITVGLKFFMWSLLFKVFILLEFGAVFFIFSAFIFIWYNMRSGPKKKGEISAYSVFNPNCEVIDGTFTAEQFERELLHKM